MTRKQITFCCAVLFVIILQNGCCNNAKRNPVTNQIDFGEEYILVNGEKFKEKELFVMIKNSYSDKENQIFAVTNLLADNLFGAEITISRKGNRNEYFDLYVIRKYKDDHYDITFKKRQIDENKIITTKYLIEPHSDFEKLICDIVKGIIKNPSLEMEQYDAEQLLKVLNDRKTQGKWEKFYISSDGTITKFGMGE